MTDDQIPHSADAERAVLGAILLDEKALREVAGSISDDDFYDERYRVIYRAVISLAQNGEPVDLLTVKDELTEDGNLHRAGGSAQLSALCESLPDISNVAHYARIIKEKARQRRLADAAERLSHAAAKGQEVENIVREILANAIKREDETGIASCRGRFVPPKEGYTAYLGYLDGISKQGDPGIPSGFRELDAVITGFRPGSLSVICGETSHGKTSLALSMAIAQSRAGVSVGYASLEVPFELAENKIVSHIAGISFVRVERSASAGNPDWPLVNAAAAERAAWKLSLLDKAALSLDRLRTEILRYQDTCRLDILYVDYLQLMHPEKAHSREREVSSLSLGLKELSREFSIPVIVLSQLRRIDPRAEDHRPSLNRLRDSGQIEQDANLVLGTYWPHRMHDMIECEDGEERLAPWAVAEVSVLKNTFGACEVLKPNVDWQCGRFWDNV